MYISNNILFLSASYLIIYNDNLPSSFLRLHEENILNCPMKYAGSPLQRLHQLPGLLFQQLPLTHHGKRRQVPAKVEAVWSNNNDPPSHLRHEVVGRSCYVLLRDLRMLQTSPQLQQGSMRLKKEDTSDS